MDKLQNASVPATLSDVRRLHTCKSHNDIHEPNPSHACLENLESCTHDSDENTHLYVIMHVAEGAKTVSSATRMNDDG